MSGNGFRKIWFLDAIWTDCPEPVIEQISQIWRMQELGNDHYIYKTTLDQLQELHDAKVMTRKWDKEAVKWGEAPVETDLIIKWVKEKEPTLEGDIEFIIHYWW